MIITKLELENWMRIRGVSLEFGRGINLIYGRNEIGKSSIIEAIRGALVGDVGSGRAEYRRFRPWGSGAGVRAGVRLCFSTSDAKEYRISKTFPKGEARLFLGDVALAEDAEKVQRKIYDILGISEKNAGLFDLLFIDQGGTLSIFDKKANPLNEDTRSYIKDVIKETALQSFRELQERLNGERDVLFTNPTMKKFKSGRNAPLYVHQLEQERELSRRLGELEGESEEYRRRLLELALLERKAKRSRKNRREKEEEKDKLKSKLKALEEKEKKDLELKPLFQDHRRYGDIEEQLTEIQRELPRLYALRGERLGEIEVQLNQLRAEEKRQRQRQLDLRQKKKETGRLEESKRLYEDIEKERRELEKLDGLIRESRERLPLLLAVNRRKLKEKLEETGAKIKHQREKREQQSDLEKQLAQAPKIVDDDVVQLRKRSAEATQLKIRCEAARSAIQMDFRMTPYAGKEIEYSLRLDGGEAENLSAAEPVEIKDFQQLSFEYPETFAIDIHGSPAEVDMEALQKEYGEKQEQLAGGLRKFQVETVEDLESKYRDYRELESKLKGMTEQLLEMPELKTLETEKAEIAGELEQLAGDVSKYCGPEHDIETVDRLEPTEAQLQQSYREQRDQLTRLKSEYDSHEAQREKVLNRRTPEAFESEYDRKKKAHLELRETLDRMEPKDIKDVSQEHLDSAADRLNDTAQKITAKENEKQLLESMEVEQEESKPGEQPEKAENLEEHTAQQIREAVSEKKAIREKLTNQRDEILSGRTTEEYRTLIRHREEEQAHRLRQITAMEPVEITALEKANHRFAFLEAEIKEINEEIEQNNLQKAALDAGLKNYSQLIEDKHKTVYRHRRLLDGIKTEITDIYGLKLLLKVIEEEKEKAEGQVFKPVQDRVMQSFDRLVPNRYRLELDENMEIGVSALTPDGKYREGIGEDLSFGTREQLSFLLRLAVAEQLSKKEPQLMILDDSFVNTDANRLPSLLKTMEEASRQIQFLVFTCKETDYTHYKTRHHAINLEELLID